MALTISKHRSPPLADDQSGFSKVGKNNNGTKGLEQLVQNVQKTKEDGMRMFIEMMKMPPLDEGKQDNSAAMAASFQSSSAQAESAVITAKTAEIQERVAKAQQSQLVGKNVKLTSTRSFSGQAGEMVKFNFDVGKNVPKNATISGTVTILDANKRKIASKKVNYMNIGKNEFLWDGLSDSGKLAKPGSYSIEVKAHYKNPGDAIAHNAKVNTMTESKILEVNIEKGEALLSDGSTVPIADIPRYIAPEEANKAAKRDLAQDLNLASSLHNKQVYIKEDTVQFEGLSNTKLGFNSPREIKNAEVKIVVKQDRETKAIDIEPMDLKRGRNIFTWAGHSTKNEMDISEKQNGKTFPKLPQGIYEYMVYVTEPGGSPQLMSPRSEVLVSSVEFVQGTNNLILEDGSNVPEASFDGLASNNNNRSITELANDAANFVSKRIEVPRIANFDGTNPYYRPFNIVYGKDVEMSFSMNITDMEGHHIKKVDIGTNDVDTAFAASVTYDNLDTDSQTKLVEWIGPAHNDFWEFTRDKKEVSYTNLHPDNKEKADQYIIDQVKLGAVKKEEGFQLKSGFVPTINAAWDGQNDKGDTMPEGDYVYSVSYSIKDTSSGETQELSEGSKVALRITHTKVEDGEVRAILEDGREIIIEGTETFVAG